MKLDKIKLKCPKCKREKLVDREPFDPSAAVIMELECYDCGQGGFDDPVYIDKDGKQIL